MDKGDVQEQPVQIVDDILLVKGTISGGTRDVQEGDEDDFPL